MSDTLDDRIRSIEEAIKELKGQNIEHDELGEANGFHEGQKAKDLTLDFLQQIVSGIKQHKSKLNTAILEQNLKEIENNLSSLDSEMKGIQQIVEEGVHNEQFPNQRKHKINNLNATETNIKKNLHTLEQDLKLEAISETLGETDYAERAKKELEAVFDQVKEHEAESRRILDNLQNKVMQEGVQESVETFGKLRKHHEDREFYWLMGVGVSAGLAIVAFACIVFCDLGPLPDGVPQTISLFMKRLIAISAPLVFLKLTLTKYNVERNLRIIYDHRETVLKEYKNFETAIGNDVEAKNAFRLEIAKYIFSDPQTGYLIGKEANEINVNPIINMAEKMAKGG